MKKNIHRYCLILVLLLSPIFFLCSCTKEQLKGKEEIMINYQLVLSGYSTKGQLINDSDNHGIMVPLENYFSSFHSCAYNGSTPVFDYSGLSPANIENVAWSDGRWSMSHDYFWPNSTELAFYAYANLPEVEDACSVTMAPDGETLHYDTSKFSSAEDMEDILMGYYKGKGGGTGTAKLVFVHPLSAVEFYMGDLKGETIKRITISNTPESADFSLTSDGKGEWKNISSFDGVISQINEEGFTPDENDRINDMPYFIIPSPDEKPIVTFEFLSGKIISADFKDYMEPQRHTKIVVFLDNTLFINMVTVSDPEDGGFYDWDWKESTTD